MISWALLLMMAQQNSGIHAYQAGDFREAARYFEQQVGEGTANPETHYWLGYTYLALGRKDRAVEEMETYLKSDPRNEDVLYALARTYADIATMSLERIFQIDPQSQRAYQMRGVRFELEESWKEAIEEYKNAGNLPGVAASMGRIYETELKDLKAAEAAYTEEIERHPYNREANEFFARHAKDPKYRKLLDACFGAEMRSGCPIPKPATDGHAGVLLLEQHQARKSIPRLIRWRELEPGSPDVYYYLGEAFTDLKVATVQRLKEANAGSFRLHQILAENYASIHQTERAMDEYRKVIEMQPRLPGVHYELAKLLADTDVETAVLLLKRELAIDPQHYLAGSLLGRIYVALHQADEAIPLLKAALVLRPELWEARKALGQAWADKKDFSNALPHYEAVAKKVPDDDRIHFLLAEAYQALGRTTEAARERALHQQTLKKVRE